MTISYRLDIQALRGIAVILVVFYHANLFPVQNGFLGVDIFFVISGFLITSQITNQINNNCFSFREFYLRRAWRLLPSAYTVFFICCLLSPWVLSSSELDDFVQQIWGALSFTANFVLWGQTGYFEDASELKPLLHTWSLSVEEQYYLLAPALLVFIAKKYWTTSVFLTTALSLYFYFILIASNPNASFYATSSRIWELGIGSILALTTTKRHYKIPQWCSCIVAGAILAAVFFTVPNISPTQVNLVIVVFGTALIISTKPQWLNQGALIHLSAKIGAISYSLYLVHWPIIAFLNSANTSGGGLWWPYRLGAVFSSFLLAYLLYTRVESKFRITEKPHSRTFIPLVLVSLLIVFVSIFLSLQSSDTDYSNRFRANSGLSEQCKKANFHHIDECQTSNSPTVLLWGDSYAMHLANGLKVTSSTGIVQAAFKSCAPVKGLTLYRPSEFNLDWARRCISFNLNVTDYITKNKQIDLIIMASAWEYLLDEQQRSETSTGDIEVSTLTIKQVALKIKNTTDLARNLGKKIVVVAPPPKAGFNSAKCHERVERGLWRIDTTDRANCTIPLAAHQLRSKDIQILMDELRALDIPIYSFEDKLCNRKKCETKLDDVILYRDRGHLSYLGSEHYAKKFDLFAELKSLAR